MTPITPERMLDWFTDLEEEADAHLAQAIDRIAHAQLTDDPTNRKTIMEEAKLHLASALSALSKAQFVRGNLERSEH